MSIDNIDLESRGLSVGLVETKLFTFAATPETALPLECGQKLAPVTLAYETYGTLSPQKDNAVLVVHALTGDAHVAGRHAPDDRKAGWWDLMIGPEKPIDTNKYFVICSNCLGGCKGSTGPGSANPATGQPYGLDFPVVTMGDMVQAQAALVEHLGVARLLTVIGGSMGGMQVLDWALRYPARVASLMPIASTARLSAQGIAFDEVGRQAIMKDPNWNRGDYYAGRPPDAGLAIARMIAHITYLSEQSMREKFGRRLQGRAGYGYDFEVEFQVESYLRHQGDAFIKRFDANSYLYITKAVDYYDAAAAWGEGSLVRAFQRLHPDTRALVISFTSDWLFPTAQSKEIVKALQANGIHSTFVEIPSDYGHDAFLLPNEQQENAIRGFLAATLRQVRSVGWPGGAVCRHEDEEGRP